MTKDEFEQGYAKRSKVTVEWLHEHDRFGLPCYCEQEGCEGWQMAHLTKHTADLAVCSPEFHSALMDDGEIICMVCTSPLSR